MTCTHTKKGVCDNTRKQHCIDCCRAGCGTSGPGSNDWNWMSLKKAGDWMCLHENVTTITCSDIKTLHCFACHKERCGTISWLTWPAKPDGQALAIWNAAIEAAAQKAEKPDMRAVEPSLWGAARYLGKITAQEIRGLIERPKQTKKKAGKK